MSVIGVSFGNEAAVIGQAQRGGIDVILNENSNRRNPCLVSFQGSQRFTGEGALSIARSNYKNTARELKRLIGRTWGDPDLQADIARFPFEVMEHPNVPGGVGVVLSYADERQVFSPEQLVAMMLGKVVDIAQRASEAGTPVADSVVSIPGWYTDRQRRAMMDACQIAGLNCLRLMHETTATALAYGIYRSAKGHFDAEKPHFVMFLDLGHSGYSVSICTFVAGSLTVKSSQYDRNLGGRDMDYAVAQHFAKVFQEKNKLPDDPMKSPKAMLKLLDAAEKAKKTLSPVGVDHAMVNVECLMEDRDFNYKFDLSTFEELLAPLVVRLEAPIAACLTEVGITASQLDAVEIVGGGSRVPAVRRKFSSILGTDPSALNFGLSTTMNAEEAVARGCALQCAMLSSRFKVKEFKIVEAVPYAVQLAWDGKAEEAGGEEDDAAESVSSADSVVIFNRGDATPIKRRVVFKRAEPFSIRASYVPSESLPPGTASDLANFLVEVPATQAALGPARIRVEVRHDIHGIVSIASAQLMEEVMEEDKKEEPAPAPAGDAVPMDVDSPAADGDSKAADADSKATDADSKAADVDGPPTKPAEGDATTEEVKESKKKKFRKVNLDVQSETSSMTKQVLDLAVEKEAQMAQQDRILQETADKRNELESYIYATRDRLIGDLKPYFTEDAAAAFSKKIEEAEEWLYSDEGFDSNKSTYSAKLIELQALGEPAEARIIEEAQRPAACASLRGACELYIKFANSTDDATAHIGADQKTKVRDAANEASNWMDEQLELQTNCPLTKPAVLTVSAINDRAAKLHATCKPIMNLPKPAPKPAEEKAAEEKVDAPAAGEPTAKNSDGMDVDGAAKPGREDANGTAAPESAEPVPMESDEGKQ
jgi:heat shock protein 4